MMKNSSVNTYVSRSSIESLTEQNIEDSVTATPGSPRPLVQIISESLEGSNSHNITSSPKVMKDSTVINIADSSVLHEEKLNANKTAKEEQKYISQENGVPSFSNKMIIQHNENSRKINSDGLYSKLLVIFGVCFIIGCYAIPITLYGVSRIRTTNTETSLEFSHKRNISAAKIELAEVCNFSASNLDLECTEQILLIYETLRTINLPSSQQYCSERVETLFCDALMECSNESYVKDIVCQQVRQEYCTAEWRMLEVDNQTDGLIDCEEYEETAQLNCGDQFGVANDGSVCLPLCEEFSLYSDDYTTPHIAVTASTSAINIITGIIVIAISFWKRKSMFRFPQVIVVINAGIQAILHCLQFSTTVSVGRWNALCSSRFLFDAFDNPTAYCTVQGSLIASTALLYTYFWLLYILDLALKVFYPLKSAKLNKCKNRRIIYIVEVLTVVLVATVPPFILAFGSNYRVIGFPPIFCGIDPTFQFYALAIPILITNGACCVIMILVIYKLHMHYGIFKMEHQESVGRQVLTCQFTVPEVKIVFVLSYWLLGTILTWTSYGIADGRAGTVDDILERYIDCREGGSREGHDCHILRQQLDSKTIPALEVIFLFSIAFLNFASLPFVIEYQSIKKSVRKAAKKLNLAT